VLRLHEDEFISDFSVCTLTQIRNSITGSVESSLSVSVESRLQRLAARSETMSRVRMAHYKGTIVVTKLLSNKGATFTRLDELEMTAVC